MRGYSLLVRLAMVAVFGVSACTGAAPINTPVLPTDPVPIPVEPSPSPSAPTATEPPATPLADTSGLPPLPSLPPLPNTPSNPDAGDGNWPSLAVELETPGSIGLTIADFVANWNEAAPIELLLVPHGLQEYTVEGVDAFSHRFTHPALASESALLILSGSLNSDGTIRAVGVSQAGAGSQPFGRAAHEALLIASGVPLADLATVLEYLEYEDAQQGFASENTGVTVDGLRVRLARLTQDFGDSELIVLVREDNL